MLQQRLHNCVQSLQYYFITFTFMQCEAILIPSSWEVLNKIGFFYLGLS